ncbi:MAG TPA: hypothetical protein VMF30_06285 [Pirellulales bacterium]|nr:hypothetical protein [Pirellulales bacterium]
MIELAETPRDAAAPLPFTACRALDEPAIAPEAVDPAEVEPPVLAIGPDEEISTLAVVELLLKNDWALNRLVASPRRQRELLPKFLAIAVACFTIYGAVATGVLNGFAWKTNLWLPHLPPARLGSLSIANLLLAYTLGLIAANGICLPSFYFYGLLAGLRTTMLAIATHAVKAMASGGLALVGLLPVYLGLALLPLVLPRGFQFVGHGSLALLGLALPFLAGLRGATSLFVGLVGLADTMHPARRGQRECLLRRMMLAWIGCYTFVTPVVIYCLWSWLGHWTSGFGN